MKNDYSLLIFNNGYLISVKSPLACLFNTETHSLTGKRLKELFIPDTIDRLLLLGKNKKTTVHLCAKSNNAVFDANVEKINFQKAELIIIYTKENLNITNSEENPMLRHTALEQLFSNENEAIFQLIDEMRTTRNIPQIRQLKERIHSLYQKLDQSVLDILKVNPITHYQYESFNFVLTVKSYLDDFELKYSDRICVSFQNFFAAYVLGNRDALIGLLDDFFRPCIKNEKTRVIVNILQKDDCAIAEFTVLSTVNTKMEISEELTDFSQNEKYILAKNAGCKVNVYRLKNAGMKMTITYDAYNSYRLYEKDSKGGL